MVHQKSAIAIIPARGGSKSIPKKNIKLLNGKPLIAYSIEAAKGSKYVTNVFVSTDSEEIAKVAKEYGADIVYEKEENTDQFDLSKESYLRYSLSEIEKAHGPVDMVLFVQATSPLTTSGDIDGAFELLFSKGYDSVFSVCRFGGGFHCGGFLWDERANSINYDYRNRKRRQELPKTYLENGAFYIMTAKGLKEHQNRIHGKKGFYVMPKDRSFEIDEPEDWGIVEDIFRLHKSDASGIIKLLKGVSLLILDFDGVLTDNRVMIDEEGNESVACSRGDGLGLEMLRTKTDVKIIVMTKEKNNIAIERCKKLKIECINGITDKKKTLEEYLQREGLEKNVVCYMGNDLNDLDAMISAGIRVAPADSVDEIKNIADYVTDKEGGYGAVRELADLIVKAKEEENA